MAHRPFQQGTAADVVQNLHEVAATLRSCAAALAAQPRSYMTAVQGRLLTAAASELDRIDQNLRHDTRLLAWRSRNVFEIFLLLEKTATEHEAKVFAAQALTDEIDILEGLIGLGEKDDPRLDSAKREVQLRYATLAKHGATRAKYWQVADLAKHAEHKTEYAAFFKVYSKYVHPSGWSVLAPAETLDSHEYQEIFIHTIQTYAHQCRGHALEMVSKLSASAQ